MYNRDYYQNNKERIKKRQRDYYHANKHNINTQAKEKRHNMTEEEREKYLERQRVQGRKASSKQREIYLSDKEGYNQIHMPRKLINEARKRAKRKDLEFSITVEDIAIPTHCPVLGFELSLKAEMSNREFSPTIDRIDQSKGYTPGNVCVISFRANRLKSDSSIEEIEAILKYMKGIL